MMTWELYVLLRLMLSSILLVAAGIAQETPAPDAERPACNAANRGKVWPETSTRDACHPTVLCTLNVFRYRWEPMTVSYSQLAKHSKTKPPCESNATAATATAAPAASPTPEPK